MRRTIVARTILVAIVFACSVQTSHGQLGDMVRKARSTASGSPTAAGPATPGGQPATPSASAAPAQSSGSADLTVAGQRTLADGCLAGTGPCGDDATIIKQDLKWCNSHFEFSYDDQVVQERLAARNSMLTVITDVYDAVAGPCMNPEKRAKLFEGLTTFKFVTIPAPTGNIEHKDQKWSYDKASKTVTIGLPPRGYHSVGTQFGHWLFPQLGIATRL